MIFIDIIIILARENSKYSKEHMHTNKMRQFPTKLFDVHVISVM